MNVSFESEATECICAVANANDIATRHYRPRLTSRLSWIVEDYDLWAMIILTHS